MYVVFLVFGGVMMHYASTRTETCGLNHRHKDQKEEINERTLVINRCDFDSY